MARNDINTAGALWPRFYSTGKVDPVDVDPTVPNTDNRQYWAYYTNMPIFPSIDLNYYKNRAQTMGVAPADCGSSYYKVGNIDFQGCNGGVGGGGVGGGGVGGVGVGGGGGGVGGGGYAVTKDVEEKLNGRDKYGLMFYTLVGSVQGRGYPTFLIIFENRTQKGGIHVHFHRTHPFRSKDGDYNPIHNWVKGCYNWMAGNVKMGNIKAQQGDLFFVKVAESATDGEEDENLKVVKNLDFTQHKVNQYDNHRFEREVAFAEYTKAAKSNILGYVKLEQDTWLNHHEHDNVLIPKGTYAIHQCRSWEANPKGVWSLRID
jgi:hypothetical protein